MSQQNPYTAPQSNLYGGGVPMANVSLPREMLVVADGMKFILWGLVVFLFSILLAFVLVRSGPDGAQPEGPMVMGLNVLGIVGQVLTLIGMFKCTHIPVETGAKSMAQLAFYGNIVVIALSLIIKFVPWTVTETTIKLLFVLAIGSLILNLVAYFAFLSFLKKTSTYLGDALSVERSSRLMTLVIVFGVSTVGIMLITLSALFGGQAPGSGMAMLIMVLGLVALVTGIWALIVYVGTVTRIRSVIEAGVR